MAQAQKQDFFFRRKGRVHWNRRGREFSRLLVAEVCTSALLMLDTPRSEVVWEYWLPTPFASFHFTSPPVRHRVPSGLKRTSTIIQWRNFAGLLYKENWGEDWTEINANRNNVNVLMFCSLLAKCHPCFRFWGTTSLNVSHFLTNSSEILLKFQRGGCTNLF